MIQVVQSSQDSKEIKLLDIETKDFDAKKLLEVILYRDRMTNNLLYFLDQAIRSSLIDDKHGKQYLRILKYCASQFAYYQILQAYNFRINPESNDFVMANQFYKIFEDEDDLKEKVREFQAENSEPIKKIKEEIEKRYKTVLLWRDKCMKDFQILQNEFSKENPDFIKFYKLSQQAEKQKQSSFDIYSYFFSLFYSDDWFPDYRTCDNIEIIKLQCFCHQFLKLDNTYPIELYPNQTLLMIEIKEKANNLEYYRDIRKYQQSG